MPPLQLTGTVSLWTNTFSLPSFPSLVEDVETDVCIVGAGFAGITAAYILAKQGKEVVLIDKGDIASGATSKTSAHLTWSLDARYHVVEQRHGREAALLAAASHSEALQKIDEIIRTERIDCDFIRLPGYQYADSASAMEELDKEWEAVQRLGLKSVHRQASVPLPTSYSGARLIFPHQGQFHPLKYLAGLLKIIVQHGGRIYAQTHAEAFEYGDPTRITTRSGVHLTAKKLVVATHTPVNSRFAMHTKQAAYRSYVLAAGVPRHSIELALYWDLEDPYHYMRLAFGDDRQDFLVVGGNDHKTGQQRHPQECFKDLEKWARERFPMMREVVNTWSGQLMQSIDGLGFAGRDPNGHSNSYVITGDSGNGITHATAAAMLISDLMRNNENRWTEFYDPRRINLASAGTYLSENFNTVVAYGDWFKGYDYKTLANLAIDTGRVIHRGVDKVAVYRDLQGGFHACSAVCPHLGGVVRWNEVEKSWDCPCHGSRFTALGKVLNGPANDDLKEVILSPPLTKVSSS